MIYTLELTEEAQADFEDILAFTKIRWGEEQQQKYAALLNEALRQLEADPRLGRRRQGLPKGYKLYHAGRHYIAYRVENQVIYVARILHDRMEIARHFH